MRVRLTQIDGKLPNLALMKLADWHKARGDSVYFTRRLEVDLFEPHYDRVYGSAIFAFSRDRLERFLSAWPNAIIGGTGTLSLHTIESVIGQQWKGRDYSLYPRYQHSLGFTQRGCRLKCKFCVVPAKEGKPRSVNTIHDIWRAEPWPKKLHLLDNDFFGQPEDQWRARIAEIAEGGFKICLNQGINIRLINDNAAKALASIEYRDDQFQRRRLYTAWDNLKDETVFFRGLDKLERHGIPAEHVMAYMLVGFDPAETWERILHRFDRMVARGVLPYPMVFDNRRKDLKQFQRWAVRGLYRAIPFEEYNSHHKADLARERSDASAPLLAELAAQ